MGCGVIMRVGQGWDTHRLVQGRDLILGGVKIAFEKGLQGHSDADVLLHAVTDALLGAAGLGDIGRHFPDTDPQYKGSDSGKLLQAALAKVCEQGWELVNIDSTILAQAPKLAPYIPQMCERLAQILSCDVNQVNIKAKTAEHMGSVGQGVSMEAHAVCMLQKWPLSSKSHHKD